MSALENANSTLCSELADVSADRNQIEQQLEQLQKELKALKAEKDPERPVIAEIVQEKLQALPRRKV